MPFNAPAVELWWAMKESAASWAWELFENSWPNTAQDNGDKFLCIAFDYRSAGVWLVFKEMIGLIGHFTGRLIIDVPPRNHAATGQEL